ncbi:MAG: hypothetical protein AAFQ79_16250 [Pseudomonadota bacterium]
MGILREVFQRFRDDERGMVTTDYIFMTAMMMGTSVSVTSGVVNGSIERSNQLGQQIEFIGRAALNNDLSALSGFTFGGRTVTTDQQTEPEAEETPWYEEDNQQAGTDPEPEPEPDVPAVFQPEPSTLNARQTERWEDDIAARTDTRLANLIRNQLNKVSGASNPSKHMSIAGMAIVEMQARGLDTSMQERWYNDLL